MPTDASVLFQPLEVGDPQLAHRIVMAPHAEIDGTTSDAVLGEILDGTAAPR